MIINRNIYLNLLLVMMVHGNFPKVTDGDFFFFFQRDGEFLRNLFGLNRILAIFFQI